MKNALEEWVIEIEIEDRKHLSFGIQFLLVGDSTWKGRTYLIDVIKVGFHALNSDVFVGLGGLGLEHFGESTLSFLADQSVL